MSVECHDYSVHFDDDDDFPESLRLTPLGANRYRVEDSTLWRDSANLGDVILADIIADKKVRFRAVLEKSKYNTLRLLIPKQIADSEGLTVLLGRLTGIGGVWERAFGGLLIVHIPPNVEFDLTKELAKLAEKK